MSPIPRILRAVALGAVLVIPAVAGATPASAAAVSCPVVYWGSLPKVVNALGPTESIVDLRTGRHACYDRVVVDIRGSGPVGYDVRYVDDVLSEGEGRVIGLAGGAKIQIVVHAPTYDIDTGASTFTPLDQARSVRLTDVDGYRTFRQVAYGGSFEGQTTFGLGVRAQLPMRAFVLSGPGTGQRLVVDVAHKWGSV